MAPRHSLCRGAGNAKVFALRCCCCRPVVSVYACGRHNQQPTKPLRKEEEDLTSWLTPAFLVLPKTTTRKKIVKFTAYFAPSQFFHCLTEYNILIGNYFSSCDLLIFLALSETMYFSAPLTITCIPDLTEEFSICTSGTLRRKGGMSAIPNTKILCLDQFCVTKTGKCRPKVPTFGCQGDMLPTCRQHSQPRAYSCCPREHVAHIQT
jgi:hypothetical protein